MVSVLNCLVIGHLHTVHLQLEVVPLENLVNIGLFPLYIRPVAASLDRPWWHVTCDLLRRGILKDEIFYWMNEFNFETHGRVFEEEVPVDRILALHRSVSIGKDDL